MENLPSHSQESDKDANPSGTGTARINKYDDTTPGAYAAAVASTEQLMSDFIATRTQ